jgi:probable HAF family extracellular repeat protein
MLPSVLAALTVAAISSMALADAQFVLTPLGYRADSLDTIPLLVNNSGVVIGFADVGTPSDQTPFLLSTLPPVPLPASPGNTLFSPQAINNSGTLVGFLMPDAANPLPTIYSAALYQNGQYVPLAPPPGSITDDFRASGTNNLGTVVGWDAESDGHVRAVLWTNGQPTWIDPNAGEASLANAINDKGWIAGATGPSSGAYHQPVVWHDGTATYLPLPPGATSGGAAAINNAGQVLVTYTGAGLGNRFLLWDGGAETLLPSLPSGDDSTFTDSLNTAGVVVGTSGGRAVYWRDGQIEDLNDLISPDSGWLLTNATSIDDAGDIVGYGTLDGVDTPFLLTPTGDGSFAASGIPEPASLALLALGSTVLLKRRRA